MNPQKHSAPLPVTAVDAAATVRMADEADRSTPEEDRSDAMESPIPAGAVNAGGFALNVLATLATLFALQWARDFLVPLLIGILITYTLNPVMLWLDRLRVPRLLGATLLVLLLAGGSVLAVSSLKGEFESIMDQLPTTAHKLSNALTKLRGEGPNAIQRMQAAANELEKATSQAVGGVPAGRPAQAEARPIIKLGDWLVAGSVSVAGFLGEATMVFFLVFFLLWAGDIFKRKLVKVAGSSLSEKKITVHILDDINTSVQRYMWMLLVTNSLLALMMWAALRTIGIENAGAWAIFAGFLHIIPYFGPVLITLATGISAFMQFGSFSMMLITAGASLAIATFVGMFVTTWMAGRIAKMNAAAVFIGLLFWGWLWGLWGLLLGIPIIVIVKVISERVEGMQAFGELLAE